MLSQSNNGEVLSSTEPPSRDDVDIEFNMDNAIVTDQTHSGYGKNFVVKVTVPKNIDGTIKVYTQKGKLLTKKLSDIKTKNTKVKNNKKTYYIYYPDLTRSKMGSLIDVDFIYANQLIKFNQAKVISKTSSFSLKKLKDAISECDDWYQVSYGTSKKIPIFLKGDNDKPLAGKTMYLKFKGKTYKKTTNSKGIVYFKVPKNLKPGSYSITTKFLGDGTYSKYIDRVGFGVSMMNNLNIL